MDEVTFAHYISLKVQFALVFGFLDIFQDDVEAYQAFLEGKHKHKLKSA